MSRIGKHAIEVPKGVEVKITGQTISAKGKLGQNTVTVNDEMQVAFADNKVTLTRRHDTRRSKMMWGTSRTLVNNLVQGVANGFTETLEINGVGYRAAVAGKDLVLQLGFTHEIKYPDPARRYRQVREADLDPDHRL